jgi:hypothetical protein
MTCLCDVGKTYEHSYCLIHCSMLKPRQVGKFHQLYFAAVALWWPMRAASLLLPSVRGLQTRTLLSRARTVARPWVSAPRTPVVDRLTEASRIIFWQSSTIDSARFMTSSSGDSGSAEETSIVDVCRSKIEEALQTDQVKVTGMYLHGLSSCRGSTLRCHLFCSHSFIRFVRLT